MQDFELGGNCDQMKVMFRKFFMNLASKATGVVVCMADIDNKKLLWESVTTRYLPIHIFIPTPLHI